MKTQLQINIVDTLSYFDTFSHPLTLNEIRLYLHYCAATRNEIKNAIAATPIIEEKYGYYFLKGNRDYAIKRKIQKKENKRKLKLASESIYVISKIPGVKMVALTGSLALGNANRDDDIDLFIVTRKNMLWTTRLIVNLYAKVIGLKRKYRSRVVKDKLCLNMFLDEREIEFNTKNLYVAHELMQMKIYYDESNFYQRIMNSNPWLEKYFPNYYVIHKSRKIEKKWFDRLLFNERLVSFVNYLLFTAQFIYMSKKITREKISLYKAFFHPADNKNYIMNEYKKRSAYYLNMLSVDFDRDIYGIKEKKNGNHKMYN